MERAAQNVPHAKDAINQPAVVPSGRSARPVIPSERSESRDLHPRSPAAQPGALDPVAATCRSATPARTSGATSVPSSSIARMTVRWGIPIR